VETGSTAATGPMLEGSLFKPLHQQQAGDANLGCKGFPNPSPSPAFGRGPGILAQGAVRMLPAAIRQLAPLVGDVAGSFATGQAVAQYAVPAVATKGGLFGSSRVTVPMSEPLPGVDVPKYTAPPPAKLEVGGRGRARDRMRRRRRGLRERGGAEGSAPQRAQAAPSPRQTTRPAPARPRRPARSRASRPPRWTPAAPTSHWRCLSGPAAPTRPPRRRARASCWSTWHSAPPATGAPASAHLNAP
jgi:hypothetical protein